MIRILTLMFALLTASHLIHAQFDYSPDCVLSNPELKTALHSAKKISMLQCCGSLMGSWATSTLGPSKPFKTFNEMYPDSIAEDELPEAESNYESAKAHYECSVYGAQNLSDGNPATAWAEGASGSGTGEIVMAQIPDLGKRSIHIGYGKSEMIFRANARPRLVKVYLLATYRMETNQNDGHYGDIEVIGEHTITLKDVNAMQPLPLPVARKLKKPEPVDGRIAETPYYFVAIEILSVYEGAKYKDACISEIK